MAEGRKLYMLSFACGHYRGVISAIELDDRQLKYLAGGQCGREHCAPLRRPRDWDKDVWTGGKEKTPEQLQQEQQSEQKNAWARAYYHANKKKILARQQEYKKAKKEAGT